MALTFSTSLEMGRVMPSFSLPDATGRLVSSEQMVGKKGMLIVFTCNHCPYAMAIWGRLNTLAHQAKALGVSTLAINPNIHPDYPDDAPDKMIDILDEHTIAFPYLVDLKQEVAKAYGAVCTPDIYLCDHEMRLFYHGRLDDNWKNTHDITSHDLQEALVALVKGGNPPTGQIPSMGCGIKWVDE